MACFGKTHECNDRGVCLNEKCYCYSGYQGMNCNTPTTQQYNVLKK